MNKQEAIETIKDNLMFELSGNLGISVNRNDVIDIISQIDEPQTVVVPKEVAEWIEIHKKSFAEASAIDMYDNLTLDNSNGYYHEVWLWVVYHHYDFIRAWHEGYEVEQEQLYTVEIPNPESVYPMILYKTDGGGVILGTCYTPDNWKKLERNQLTETEIRKDFEWAWQWAKPVEEEE